VRVGGGSCNGCGAYRALCGARIAFRAATELGFVPPGQYMMRRRWDYFVKYLLGAEPPREFEFGQQRLVP